MNKTSAALACCISALMPWASACAEDITWLSADFPPLATFDKDAKDIGYMNLLLKQVQQALPQHRIQEEVLPWPRVLFVAKNGGAYCSAMAAQTPERESYLRFTAPYGYVYPVGLVTRAKTRTSSSAFSTKGAKSACETSWSKTTCVRGSRVAGPTAPSLMTCSGPCAIQRTPSRSGESGQLDQIIDHHAAEEAV